MAARLVLCSGPPKALQGDVLARLHQRAAPGVAIMELADRPLHRKPEVGGDGLPAQGHRAYMYADLEDVVGEEHPAIGVAGAPNFRL